MAHLEPLAREQLSALEPMLAASEAMMGFVPNSMLTMAYMPQLNVAFTLLAGTVFGNDLRPTLEAMAQAVPADKQADQALPADMLQLIAYASSLSAGCQYCQAQRHLNAHRFGLSEEKLSQVLNFADSSVYSEPEKAVINIALAAGQVPNATEAAHFDALKAHFTERQIVQIVATISLFGFLNRWNDTMATALEETPLNFASTTLGAAGWHAGKHGG